MVAKTFEQSLKEQGLLASVDISPLEFISTHCYTLNYIISGKFFGGLPLGKIIEIYGDPIAGKSLLLYHLFAEIQRLKGLVWYDDPEFSLLPRFAESVGVDLKRIWVPDEPSDSVEQHFERVQKILEEKIASGSQVPMIIALDSIGALSTRHELEAGMDKVDLSKAKQIRKAMRLIQKYVKKANCLYVINNHSYDVIGERFPMKLSSGGGGLKFHSYVRLLIELRAKFYDPNKKIVGVRSKISVTKNRIIEPFKTTLLVILFKSGINLYSYLFDTLKIEGFIRGGSGGHYQVAGFPDKMKKEEVKSRYEEILKLIDEGKIHPFEVDGDTLLAEDPEGLSE